MGTRVVRVDIRGNREATEEEIFQAAVDVANGAGLLLLRDEGANVASDEDRSEATRLLTLIADGERASVANEWFPLIPRLLADLRVWRTVNITIGRGFWLGYHHDFKSAHALLDYAVVLALDAKLPFGELLARCRLPTCGRFYIAMKNPKGGPPNKTYCSPAHRDEHHNSAERKAASKPRARHK